MADRPWESQGGLVLGCADIKAGMPQEPTVLHVDISAATVLTGKHAIFLKFASEVQDKSISLLTPCGSNKT